MDFPKRKKKIRHQLIDELFHKLFKQITPSLLLLCNQGGNREMRGTLWVWQCLWEGCGEIQIRIGVHSRGTVFVCHTQPNYKCEPIWFWTFILFFWGGESHFQHIINVQQDIYICMYICCHITRLNLMESNENPKVNWWLIVYRERYMIWNMTIGMREDQW